MFLYYRFYPVDILIIPAIIFALWAQFRVKSAYQKYAKIRTESGITGADVARKIMMRAEVKNVNIEAIPGELTDHYDPTKKVLRLSSEVYSGTSISALGIAAHEVGHAIQDAKDYKYMRLRHLMYPISSIGSTLAFPLFFIGLIFNFTFSAILIRVGIWMFSAAVAFTVVTLPVEFDASRRAIQALEAGGFMSREEISGVRYVLGAAAMTYVAAAATAVIQLLRLIMIARSRN
ncbi:MAG: zinc metallopeptidase [Candidatus Hydrogenedentes bacterium]|jgi:Zn-dependent membrane protease YugP|nr:zinc metallopeptidase [Candidatus Hydrogenedentota bacterium]